MLKVTGNVTAPGARDFTRRMTDYPLVFEEATGETLVTGTLNIRVEKPYQLGSILELRAQE
jgi:hypothetical protein